MRLIKGNPYTDLHLSKINLPSSNLLIYLETKQPQQFHISAKDCHLIN